MAVDEAARHERPNSGVWVVFHKVVMHTGFLLRVACAMACLGYTAMAAATPTTITVGTEPELQNAVATANGAGGSTTILLGDGTYTLTGMLNITAPNVTIAGKSGSRDRVVIQGDAMSADATIKILVRAAASNFQIRDLTLQKSGWHLLQVVGEANADGAIVHNVVFRDAYQQLLKVSIDPNNMSVTGDNGLVEDSLFEYSAGIGPEYYIGGIDVHGGKSWVVRGNTFRSIISPSQTVAEFAIHFWNTSAGALVEKNVIVNCDRAIGFGLDVRGNTGGIIRNNMIYHAANDGQFADTAIYIESSPGTQIYNNSIYMENAYPHSIEYRGATTTGVLVVNNLANKPVAARDGATGTAGSNIETAAPGWFVNPTQGDLHLSGANTTMVDTGRAVSGLTDDFDGTSRPQGNGFDIGAQEWVGVRPNPPTNVGVY